MPKVSVIIASVNGFPAIAECLTALVNQQCDFDFEIIIADRTQDGTTEYISTHFPRIKLIKLDHPCGIPEMRAIAMAEASGEFLVITEDHCIAPENWLAKIVEAHGAGYEVIGGAVENACTLRLVDWAVFFV